jgi:hypothetical protein
MAWLALGLALAAGEPAAAQTADLKAAQTMVERTYRAYCKGCRVDLDRHAGRLLSPRLMALVERDRRLTPKGDVGALDGDPICDCQDYAITDVRVAVKAGPAADRATAAVSFRNFGEPQTIRLDLVAVAGGWRIDNVHSKGAPDLADYLQKHAGGR